jgi:tetratricopeptide (TPR) repeat protein
VTTIDAEHARNRLDALAALLNARRYDEALAASDTMLRDTLIHPLPLAVSATARQQAGRFDEAIVLWDRRARMMAGEAQGWVPLAVCLFAARRPELALEAWDKALALAPTDPAILAGKAGTLRGLGQGEAARALYRQALTLAPGQFEAGYGLAQLALEAGDHAEAEAIAVRLLAAHPEHPSASFLAARVAFDGGQPALALDRLKPLLALPTLSPEQRADALLLRSRAEDGLDRVAEAFASAAQGKATQRALFAQRAAGRESEVDKLGRLATWFDRADRADWQGGQVGVLSEEPQAHIFLVGFPRSGTTLLEQVLAGHPNVVALEEAPTFADAYAEFMTGDLDLARLAALSDADAASWRERYWSIVRGHGAEPAGRIFLDKAPAGTLYLPLLAKLFPTAKVLFAVRDPRDVVLSCFRNNFQLNAMTYAFTDLGETAACYDACMALAQVYRRVLPLDLREVRHEALVEGFAGELAGIADFLRIEVAPGMADIAGTSAGRTVRTPSAVQVREGLNRRGLARWRAYERELAPVLGVLAPWVERWGY